MPTVRPYRGNLAQICRPDMAIPPPHGKLTADSIKAATGQFDLESIFKLAMSHMSIRVIENLALCPNLTVRPAPDQPCRSNKTHRLSRPRLPLRAGARPLPQQHQQDGRPRRAEATQEAQPGQQRDRVHRRARGADVARDPSAAGISRRRPAARRPPRTDSQPSTPHATQTPRRRPRYAEFVQNAPRRATSSRAWTMHKSL